MSHPSDGGAAAATVPWGELFRGERGLYTTMVLLGVVLHALQILVIAIIMPTVVADVGGADFYAWPAMLYTIGAIIGAASVGPVWTVLGRRKGYAFGGGVFMVGTIICALAPDMLTLNAGRMVQGLAGGLVNGGSMALVSGLFPDAMRRRVLALNQGTWMAAQLSGPLVGGVFAQIGWWRGSFWVMLPICLVFVVVAWLRLPDEPESEVSAAKKSFPLFRLLLLSGAVFAVALAGPVTGSGARVALVVAAAGLGWFTLHLDRTAENRLYPTGVLSVFSPVGLALWILFITGMAQTTVMLFLPLLLQVVHGVAPLFISFVTIVISFGWTVGTFTVSGWSGRREDMALIAGPLFMIVGLVGITVTAQLPILGILTLSAFALGLGIGIHNVHLVARTMAAARPGEERITSAAMPSIRSVGTAFGAALAGVTSTMAGLGPATDAAEVGHAVTVAYGVNVPPLLFTAVFMVMMVRMGARARS